MGDCLHWVGLWSWGRRQGCLKLIDVRDDSAHCEWHRPESGGSEPYKSGDPAEHKHRKANEHASMHLLSVCTWLVM